jgi:integrase/recombinase XerD
MNWNFYIKSYQSYLKIERGLSANTIANYVFDIEKLCAYLDKYQIVVAPTEINESTLQEFVYEISKSVNPRSQARILSGLKSFFMYLVFENYRVDNPLELIESPRLGRKLPDTLNIQDIDNLIAAVDLTKDEGERNRAIIETLYGCGLRVSELTDLKLSDLFFDEGFIKVTGKGSKQRFVPIGEYTLKFKKVLKIFCF